MSGSGPDAYPDTVAELAELLQRDPVVVQQPWGSGDAAGADARITALLEQAPFDVRVAVVGTPRDGEPGTSASDFLATALARRIGEPGLYVVVADGGPVALREVDTPWDQTLLDLQRYRDLDAVSALAGESPLSSVVQAEAVVRTVVETPPRSSGPAATSTGLDPATVQDLADRQAELAPFELPDPDDSAEPWGTGARWAAGTGVGAGLLVLLLQTLRGWPGWGRRTPSGESRAARPAPVPAPPDPVVARAEAEAALASLAGRLRSAAPRPGQDGHDRALRARDAADLLLTSSDPLDLVGALVLARAGEHELRRRSSSALACCFFDPRHTGPLQQLQERYGDADLLLTACRACTRDVADGVEPAALHAPGRRPFAHPRPYYEGTSVWARTGYGSLTADLGAFAREVLRDLEQRR